MLNRVVLCAWLAGSAAAADWLTFGGDAERTGWARGEEKISRESVRSMRLAWSLHLDNVSKELNSLTAPIVVEQVYTPRGVKDIVIVAGSSDNLYAIDADAGKLLWKKSFEAQGAPKQQPHWLCSNCLNDTPVVDK